MSKKTIKIVAFGILGLVVVFVALIFFINYLFWKGMCRDEVIGKYISPDTRHTISYFVRDCGAASGFGNHIELDDKLILQAEPKDGNLSAPFQITWINNKKVSIKVATTTKNLNIYTEPIHQHKDIQIELDQKIIDSYRR